MSIDVAKRPWVAAHKFPVLSVFFGKGRAALLALVLCSLGAAPTGWAGSCVWRVRDAKGHSLYLGGSVHALRGTDYPLPGAYNMAFDASQRLVFEIDDRAMKGAMNTLEKGGVYRRGDSLKNHVDPRTYDYLRRFFGIIKVPEENFSRYRPWFLALMLQSPELHGLSPDLGVEGYLARRATANHKPISGLESAREHAQVFSGLNDQEAEAILLLTFIPQKSGGSESALTTTWRQGDADRLTRLTKEGYADYPAFAERLLDARNRNWIPKIERDLQSGKISFVVVGAAHLGGPTGVVALLRQCGYQVEQL
jgi:uncharacterized protein YbaP (TraB family)